MIVVNIFGQGKLKKKKILEAKLTQSYTQILKTYQQVILNVSTSANTDNSITLQKNRKIRVNI